MARDLLDAYLNEHGRLTRTHRRTHGGGKVRISRVSSESRGEKMSEDAKFALGY